MHIALGYAWTPITAGYHIERALKDLGHEVTYVGAAFAGRAGYAGTESIVEIISSLQSKPDVFFWVDSAGPYFPQDIERLEIPTLCYLVDVHIKQWRKQVARFFDIVCIAQKDYLDEYRAAAMHDNVFWIPLAAAPDIFIRNDQPRIFDVGFVGQVGRAHRKTKRLEQLKHIQQSFRINDFYRSYGPVEMSDIYSQSKIVFNTTIAGDVSMRVFEGTACGALVLTDTDKNGLPELYTPYEEIVIYNDTADLLDKIHYYLSHDREREQIANAGHQKTMSNHTYEQRAAAFVEIAQQNIQGRKAEMRRMGARECHQARREVLTNLLMLDAAFIEAKIAGENPIQRLWHTLPALLKRLLN